MILSGSRLLLGLNVGCDVGAGICGDDPVGDDQCFAKKGEPLGSLYP